MTAPFHDLALSSTAWPYQEAHALLKHIGNQKPEKGYVLFETGYGPSGLPHIGTFGEVARTTMVRKAFEQISDIPTRLFAFSDDMDGLRKVPDNIPNQDLVAKHLHKPLTAIPDPFGTHDSYGHHMNSRLQAFLSAFNFEFEFKSATECYQSGLFDQMLLNTLRHVDQIMKLMLPTLGEERQKTYSPFLPICKKTGKVLQVPILETHPESGTIVYRDEENELIETPVTGGHCKLQWKPDWGMRWAALGVDYEMHGKDLTPSAELSNEICKILGKQAPLLFPYELFLDDKGQKISKSKGNGLSMEEWLRYGPQESLALFMFQSPKKAKRLYFDVIPKAVDEYLTFLQNIQTQDDAAKLSNPVWHVHHGHPPAPEAHGLSFSLLLNLASACNPEDPSVLWGFITRYAMDATPTLCPHLDKLVKHAIHYYEDFVQPSKQYRAPNETEAKALGDLRTWLNENSTQTEADVIQQALFDIGKSHFPQEQLRDWFKACYEVLLGQSQGPRFGSFIALYGVKETTQLITRALQGELATLKKAAL